MFYKSRLESLYVDEFGLGQIILTVVKTSGHYTFRLFAFQKC